MIIKARLSFPVKVSHIIVGFSPPKSFAALAAATASSLAEAPFIATKLPPFFTRGRQYSAKAGSAATALAQAISYLSR